MSEKHQYVMKMVNDGTCASCGLTKNSGIHVIDDKVDHPAHYGGGDNPYEAIKVIEAWKLGFCLGNAIKYIARAGKKSPETLLEDLKKARWYLDREIQHWDKK
jgi:Protein of unknwon function (DUF3310)